MIQKETALQKIIDVVEDVSFPYQTSDYQEDFRDWRRRKQNPYAFRFTKNPKEATFSESQTLTAQSPAKAEQAVLNRIGTMMGILLLGYLLIENVLDKAVVLLMRLMHLHIELVFLGETHLYGDEKLVFWVSFLIHLLKYLVPAVLMQVILRLPLRVSLPSTLRNPYHLIPGIVLTMVLSVGMGMVGISHSAELEKYRLILSTNDTEDKKIIFYILMMIFVIPLVSELLLHGCLFQALRQFGDNFAIVSTVILAAVMTHNAPDALRIGLLHLTISYYVIQTGSFGAAVLLRITHEIYMFALFCLESTDNIYSSEWWLMVLIPCALGAVMGIYILLHKKQKAPPIQNQTYLNMQEKLAAFFTPLPMTAFLICCVMLLIITSMLR